MLNESLHKVLSEMFAFYFKAHNYHWNVEGPNFAQYHEFLGDLYEEVHGAIDPLAEHIRTLDVYVKGSMSDVKTVATIADPKAPTGSLSMMEDLHNDNQKVILSLYEALRDANVANENGIVNYLEERIDIHNKHGWMLRSFNK